MAEIHLHPRPIDVTSRLQQPTTRNPLPQLLQTPSGLAILELQGTINLPDQSLDDPSVQSTGETEVGRLVFPLHDPKEEGNAWIKKVWLYVGKHQRLTGEVKKLPKPVAIIRRRSQDAGDGLTGNAADELEVVEVVKYKIIFSMRPEPVT